MNNSQSPYHAPDAFVSNSMNEQRRSKKKWLIAVVIAVIAIAAVAAFLLLGRQNDKAATAISATVANVTIEQNGYIPNTIKVKKGQEVTWTNKDTVPHRLMADQTTLAGFDPGDSLETGDSYTYIFDTTGTFHYYDPADPKTFVGTVIVE